MTLDELVAGLRALARVREDEARAAEAAARELRPDYEAALPKTATEATAAGHARALELYHIVITGERDARRLCREGALLLAAAEELERDR